MRYRINNIKILPEEDKDILHGKIAKKLKISHKAISNLEIIRESIDARKKGQIYKVYTLDFDSMLELNLPEGIKYTYETPKACTKFEDAPVVVGFGPCGIFAALILAEMGLNPIVLERGKPASERTGDVAKFWREAYKNPDAFNPESNVQFGEGGAGTFSDGKLTTGIKNIRTEKVLREFVLAGAEPEILYKAKPHVGTDRLVTIVQNIRKKIEALGGQIRFNSYVKDFIFDEKGSLQGVIVEECRLDEKRRKEYVLNTQAAVLAVGHSSRDTFKVCNEYGLEMSQKPFSMGVRVEHDQSIIDKAQYGDEKYGRLLGAAEYKLVHRCKDGRGAYSFCMCPGGEIVLASSGRNQVLSNGMSASKRNSGKANSAILVDVPISEFGSDYVLAGMELQEVIERNSFELAGGYKLLETTLESFFYSDLAKVLPKYIVNNISEAMTSFGKKIKGFDNPDTTIKGPETRSSSPVRFHRDENCMSNIFGIYPAGEGAGYAGGIMSAAVDGIRVAECIAKQKQI